MGAVNEGIAGGLIIVIWQPHHKGFSASHWHPGTSVADDARRLDCAKSLLRVQIRIPGSDPVRSPWCMGVLWQFSTCSCTSASSSPCLRTDLRPARIWVGDPGCQTRSGCYTTTDRVESGGPCWCAFFLCFIDEELAWAGLIGLSVPSAATGPRSPGARSGD